MLKELSNRSNSILNLSLKENQLIDISIDKIQKMTQISSKKETKKNSSNLKIRILSFRLKATHFISSFCTVSLLGNQQKFLLFHKNTREFI